MAPESILDVTISCSILRILRQKSAKASEQERDLMVEKNPVLLWGIKVVCVYDI